MLVKDSISILKYEVNTNYELFAECADWLQSKNADKTAWSG